MTFKPTIALDFDGCVHSYDKGWQQGQIYGRLIPGFVDWAIKAQEDFILVIHSSRAATLGGVGEVENWLANQLLAIGMNGVLKIRVQAEKPPAFVTIDDRCIRFEGNWSAPELQPEALHKFKPWMQR